MEQHIRLLFKRLSFLGYRAFDIKAIVREAIGADDFDPDNFSQCKDAIVALEKYERLAMSYMLSYSK